jgi:GNAT superfamily N-acetyltransferase
MSRVRDAVLTDMDRLREIYRESSLSNQADREILLAHPEVLELSPSAVTGGRTRVAEDVSGRVVGFVTLRSAGTVLEIEDLFVDPESMRHGAGRRLVNDAVAMARRDGASRLQVTANRHALQFYEAVGFIHDGVTETLFGPGELMHLPLS